MAENNDTTVEVTDQNFDKVKEENENIVLDFWASWCGPCKMMDPVIEDLSEKFLDRVVFGKVNTEENSQIVSKFGIQAIPTFIFIKDGEVVDQARGAIPQKDMEEKIRDNFGL